MQTDAQDDAAMVIILIEVVRTCVGADVVKGIKVNGTNGLFSVLKVISENHNQHQRGSGGVTPQRASEGI